MSQKQTDSSKQQQQSTADPQSGAPDKEKQQTDRDSGERKDRGLSQRKESDSTQHGSGRSMVQDSTGAFKERP